jgi:hypothetical protein
MTIESLGARADVSQLPPPWRGSVVFLSAGTFDAMPVLVTAAATIGPRPLITAMNLQLERR